MSILIINENNEKTLFSNNTLNLVKLILELNDNNIKYKAFEVGINMRTNEVDEDNKREFIIKIDKNIDLEDTIKCTSFIPMDNLSLKGLSIYTNSKKRITPLKILKEYEQDLKELKLIGNIYMIFSSWYKEFKDNKKIIYEENYSWYKFEDNSWVKRTSKKRRHF